MIKEIYEGKVWKFGNNVSTDSIAAGRLLHLRTKPEEYAKHLFEDLRPDFAPNVAKDDFIVAGMNFGCGSSREIAPLIIKISGVSAILAVSFGRIFYRNAINNGMLLIQCDTENLLEGEVIEVDTKRREVTKKKDPNFKMGFQLGEVEKKILEQDGLLNYIQKYNTLDQF